MIKVTYEYTCDICDAMIKSPDKHEGHMPFVPVQQYIFPVPSYVYQVGHYHICAECYDVAMKPLRERFSRLHPITDDVSKLQ